MYPAIVRPLQAFQRQVYHRHTQSDTMLFRLKNGVCSIDIEDT